MATNPPAALAGHAVNLLPRSDSEVGALQAALGDRWLAGVVVRDLSDEEARARAQAWTERGVRVSMGLGDGDDRQWRRALAVAVATPVAHLNHPWFAAGRAVGELRALGRPTVVNALVSPVDERHGRVVLAPGGEPLDLPWQGLLDNLGELGIPSIKFFPMRGEAGHAAYSALVRHLADGAGPRIVEPSGGITPEHLSWLFAEADAAGVVAVPHIYGALRDAGGAIDAAALATIRRSLGALVA